MTEEAIEKIMSGREAAKKTGRHAEIMAGPVADALVDFCRQDEEFAQAVAQGGDFVACMRTVAQGCGSALSDVEAYQRAVKFYFPGAKVRVHMTVDLSGEDSSVEPRNDRERGVILDLTAFL